MQINDFALRQTFYRIPADPYNRHGEIYWREAKCGGEGYILVWPNGESHHTYHHPESTFGPSEDNYEDSYSG